jgi:hypothetical protein
MMDTPSTSDPGELAVTRRVWRSPAFPGPGQCRWVTWGSCQFPGVRIQVCGRVPRAGARVGAGWLPARAKRRRRHPAGLSGGHAGDRCCRAGDCGVPPPRGGGQVVTRVMFHDHELVLDHGIPGACPRARSSVITRPTMITALQAAATPSGAAPGPPPPPPRAPPPDQPRSAQISPSRPSWHRFRQTRLAAGRVALHTARIGPGVQEPSGPGDRADPAK